MAAVLRPLHFSPLARPKFTESNLRDWLGDGYRLNVMYGPNKTWAHAWVTHKDSGAIVCDGFSRCGKHDQPNRKIARAIAVGRLAKEWWGVGHGG